MEKLINKRYHTFEYVSRYSGVPYYYDTTKEKDVFGIGKQIQRDTAYLAHAVQPNDTLDSLALRYYNNPTFWWVIAYFNLINDPFIQLSTKYKVIKIPNISSVTFKD